MGSALALFTLVLMTVACGGAENPVPDRAKSAPADSSGSAVSAVPAATTFTDAAVPAPLPVVATVPPLATLARRVGGDAVVVTSLIPTGRSPHDFEPAPSALRGLMAAAVVVQVGSPSFRFEGRLLEPLLERRSPAPPVVSLAAVAAEDPALDLGTDPHPWLQPALLPAVAQELAAALASVDPARAQIYAEGARSFAADVTVVDARNRARLEASGCRAFLVDHPAWGAFARHYGLRQLALEEEGKAPGPATLRRVVEAARQEGLVEIWQRPGRPPGSLDSVAQSLGAEVVEMDPTSPDLLETLEKAAQRVADGCRQPTS